MAKQVHAGGNALNPVSEDDPRFDPESSGENAVAHGMEPDDSEKKGRSERRDEIQGIVQRGLERAIQHYEEHLEPDQKEATDYYYGRPFGDEQDGRSKVVSTDVRDATHAQIPSLARVFFSPERAVEFRPRGPEDEALAKQMTEYINYVVAEDNPGFLIFDAWFKDALVRRLGWVKWWWEERYRIEASEYTGLDAQAVQALFLADEVEELELLAVEQGPDGERYDVRVTRRSKDGCPKFMAVPPEEVVYTPNARSLEEAPLVAHVREVPVEDLIQLGIDEDLIEEAQGKQRSTSSDLEDARQFHGGDEWDRMEGDDSVDPSQRPVLFAEAYCLIDGDDDGVAELRLFRCVGPDFEIANGEGLGEIVDEVPMAFLTPHPEPHTIPGLSNHDLLKDVQRVKSQVLRGTLNSLAQAIEQKTEVVEGEVNMQDLINPEISGVVRVRKPGMMREVQHDFLGPATLPVLAYYDEIRENRTGQTKAAAGLDADSLQSSTKAAVAATLSASQQRIEYIARVFAETGVKRLFKGLLGLVVKHQDRPRMVRLRGEFVPIDPRSWDASMDVSVNVALGQGTPEDRIQALSGILGLQRELMTTGSPLVSNVELRNTLAKAAELAGFRNADMFFRPWGPEQEAQMQQQMANQPPPPDANMLLVQIEGVKAQQQAQNDAQKLELEKWKARMEDDRERDKMAREMALKEKEIEAKFSVGIEDKRLKAKIEADRIQMDADLRREQARSQPTSEAA